MNALAPTHTRSGFDRPARPTERSERSANDKTRFDHDARRQRLSVSGTLRWHLALTSEIVLSKETCMRILALIGVLAVAVSVASGIYFYGGFYDVSADTGGNPAVEWSLESVREASIDKHYQTTAAPAWFSTPKAVQAGAHEFAEEGCVRCHGAPGRARDKFAKGMNPEPPDLGKATKDDPPAKVFWIVKNGIRMTGMPAFGRTYGGRRNLESGRICAARRKRNAPAVQNLVDRATRRSRRTRECRASDKRSKADKLISGNRDQPRPDRIPSPAVHLSFWECCRILRRSGA